MNSRIIPLVPAYAARRELFPTAEGLDETKDLPARCAWVREQAFPSDDSC